MTKELIFRGIIRAVFLFAYGAFLYASIRHLATFFHNFESDATNWNGSYTLAISIDLTSLILTVGVMFFRKGMPWGALIVVWFFIIALTAFSWLVNWEYAMRYQSSDLTQDATLKMLNPILASAFAFLNLAYSVVAEFFNTKKQTAEELKKEADRLETLATQQTRLDTIKARMKKPGLIQRAKALALEAKTAAKEVLEEHEAPPVSPEEPLPEKLQKTLQFLSEHSELVDHWGGGSDEQLATYLGLERPASARFWWLKAMERWPQSTTDKSSLHAPPEETGKDIANDGTMMDMSGDETLPDTTMEPNTKTSTITLKSATRSEGVSQSNETGKTSTQKPPSDGSTPPLSVTVKEAAVMLGLSESYVRELRSNKKLRCPGRNKKLILVSSIKAYQHAHPKLMHNESRQNQENHHQDVDAMMHLDTQAHVRV
jgi:hypothetical protein